MKNLKLITAVFLIVFSFNRMAVAQVAKATDSVEIKKVIEKEAKAKKANEEWLKLDWPNIKRFRDDNAKVGLPASNENRVVFMGNSITIGWINTDPDFFAGRPFIDRGISGQTTPQMLIRMRADVINLKPKVVVILAGTNDIAGNTGPSTNEMIEDNLASMADLAKANGIKPILCSILPVFDYPWKPGLKPYDRIITINKWMKDYASTHGMLYLDFYSSMVDDRPGTKVEYSKDGVHPNMAGYKVMEPLVEAAIAKALKMK
jgi:lysophospholipase L1-like esterase